VPSYLTTTSSNSMSASIIRLIESFVSTANDWADLVLFSIASVSDACFLVRQEWSGSVMMMHTAIKRCVHPWKLVFMAL
jgi:hypothetical protein